MSAPTPITADQVEVGDVIELPGRQVHVDEAAPGLRQLLAVKGTHHNDPGLLAGNQLINAVVALADHADQTR